MKAYAEMNTLEVRVVSLREAFRRREEMERAVHARASSVNM
jgi:hypothetical protein